MIGPAEQLAHARSIVSISWEVMSNYLVHHAMRNEIINVADGVELRRRSGRVHEQAFISDLRSLIESLYELSDAMRIDATQHDLRELGRYHRQDASTVRAVPPQWLDCSSAARAVDQASSLQPFQARAANLSLGLAVAERVEHYWHIKDSSVNQDRQTPALIVRFDRIQTRPRYRPGSAKKERADDSRWVAVEVSELLLPGAEVVLAPTPWVLRLPIGA